MQSKSVLFWIFQMQEWKLIEECVRVRLVFS